MNGITCPAPTSVDYLGLVLAAHDAEMLGHLSFRDLPILPPGHDGQRSDRQHEGEHSA